MEKWTRVLGQDIEIRIDPSDPIRLVQYRYHGENEWKNSPFQTQTFLQSGGERDALKAVILWMNSK